VAFFAKNKKQLVVVVHACNPSYIGGRGKRITSSRPAKAKVSGILSQKQNINKRAMGVA
jgi:hypothetical protein